MDKRGQVKHWTDILVMVIITAVVVIAVFAFTNGLVQQKVEIRPAIATLYPRLFIYGAGQFREVETHTNRLEPLTIDLDKFTERNIDASFQHPENRFIAARLLLTNLRTGETTTRFWNKKWYDIYKPLASKQGTGAAISQTTSELVHIKTKTGTDPGSLIIEMVVPKT